MSENTTNGIVEDLESKSNTSVVRSGNNAEVERLETARARMEAYNQEAEAMHVWMRTEKHGPVQRPWFTSPMEQEALDPDDAGHEAANHMKPAPHQWRWSEVSPFVEKMAHLGEELGVKPVEFADRQSVMIMNPALGGRLQITNTMRAAISVYNPGDDASAHVHSPNASRIILSENGGFTTIEGERCDATRGDVILTPNGAWHEHGNDGDTPVVWLDTLDWPLIEYLDGTWLDKDYRDAAGNSVELQQTTHENGYSSRLYGHGGLKPTFVNHERGFGQGVSPMFHYKGTEIRETLVGMSDHQGDPYEGIKYELVNPASGESVFTTLSYSAQLLRKGESTKPKRETSSSFFIVMEGSGVTEVGNKKYSWSKNDIVCVPAFTWRRHRNTGDDYAILYSVSDSALMRRIGHYHAQGLAGGVVDLAER